MNPAPNNPFQAPEDAARAAAARKRTLSAMLTSLAIHAVLLVAAASLTIMIIAPKPKMMFEGKKSPSLPARKLEHAIRVKQMKKQTRKPQILQRLVTEAPSQVVLPEMPQMKTPDVKDLRDTPVMNSRAGSIGSIGGGGGGAGRGLGGGSGYSDTKFFGENVRTRAICILVDVTDSMVQKQVVEDTLVQAQAMMEKMNASTKFNLMVFRDGVDSYTPQLVYATRENAAQGFEWLKNAAAKKLGNAPGVGNTPFFAIQRAVEQGAETIFVLSDDAPYLQSDENHAQAMYDYAKDIVRISGGNPVKINVVLFKPHVSKKGVESQDYYTELSKKTGGKCTIWPPERKQELRQWRVEHPDNRAGSSSSGKSSSTSPSKITKSNTRFHGHKGIPDSP